MNPQIAIGVSLTLLAMVVYGGLHSLLASERAKRLARQWFGPSTDRWYRLAYNLVGAITFLPVLAVAWLVPGTTLYSLRFPWVLLSTAIQVLAVLLLLVGLRQTDGLRFLGLRQLAQGQLETPTMVIKGPYRWVRHPLYTAGLLFIWAIPVMTTSLLALNVGITAYLYLGSVFEERKLVALWGAEYQEYRRQVPRLIPVPWKRLRGGGAE